MPDIIYLFSESYISYTRQYLLLQDGRHNSKCFFVDQGIQSQKSLYCQMIFLEVFDVILISRV